MNRFTDALSSKKNREAKLRVEHKLMNILVRVAETNDPDNKYKAIPVDQEYTAVVCGDNAFQFALREPLKYAMELNPKSNGYIRTGNNFETGVSGLSTDPGYVRTVLHDIFDDLIIKLKLIEGRGFQPEATAKELKELHKKIDDITQDIVKLNLTIELDDVLYEAQFAREKVKNIIAERQSKMKPSKYPDELVTITSHLIDFWCDPRRTMDKSINAYSPGNTYDRSGIKDDVAKENLKTIDVKHNPGGAFLQRVLKIYFKQDLDNTQLKTLLSKVKKKVR
jgi:hypothetical protein